MTDDAVIVNDVSKVYKLYNKPSDRLKEALGLNREPLYREHYALNHISFTVKRGETVGIIGANGSGKSTILKIITGVLNPTEGSVSIHGRASALLELGAGFNMEYTGLENVYINGIMTGFTREEIDEKLDSILSFADIGDFINQPVKTYSSGMFVRLAFAVAVNIDPEILIVDEALSVGDIFFQAKCFHKFEEFKKAGKTILFVSHDLASVSKYCDRVILLDKGRQISGDDTKEMIEIYKKILVHQYSPQALPAERFGDARVDGRLYKTEMQNNPNVIEYGNGAAEIVDYAVFDKDGNVSSTVESGEEVKVMLKVKFNRHIDHPILAYTLKDVMGVELVGTNTMYEDVNTGIVEAGDVRTAVFTQKWSLGSGNFLLSLGCTGFENGEFVVYQRLYDACNVLSYSDHRFVGKWDAQSTVEVQ